MKLAFNNSGTCHQCGDGPTVVFSSLCQSHYIERRDRMSPAALRGAATRRTNNPERFLPQSADKFWQSCAHRMVRSAVLRGVLPLLDGSIACVDCGKAASIYEHRDYGRPLDVQPVCQPCNSLRGTATWPSAEQFNFAKTNHDDC